MCIPTPPIVTLELSSRRTYVLKIMTDVCRGRRDANDGEGENRKCAGQYPGNARER